LIILEQIAEEEGPVIEEEAAAAGEAIAAEAEAIAADVEAAAKAVEAEAETLAKEAEAEGEAILNKIEEAFGDGEVDEVEEECAGEGGAGDDEGGGFASDAQRQDHFDRHGSDFGAATPEEYERQADDFLNGPRGDEVLEKVRPNGDIVRYNPTTDEFGVTRADGTIRTYFKPDPAVHPYPTNLDYFNAQ
jgi:filamentous hemagglutinin